MDIPLSYINSAIQGEPMPYLTYHHGGFMVHNSYFAEHEWKIKGYTIIGDNVSHVTGANGHLQNGESAAVRKHESGHMRQWSNGGATPNPKGLAATEYQSDQLQGTFNYGMSPLWAYQMYGKEGFRSLAAGNAYYAGKDILSAMFFITMVNSTDTMMQYYRNNAMMLMYLDASNLEYGHDPFNKI